MSRAYYNEIEPYAAQWLRNLIDEGVIAPGDVDTRSIEDVRPSDLAGYTQCHFFAGIGVWSYALRLAGWSDDRPVWTGSCPCQPFSNAGKGRGFDDKRHLWPAWHHLIRVCRPPIVFGEQVASKDGYAWLDLVQADLEGLDYACGPHVSPAAGYGAPHERHRLWFAGVALGDSTGFRVGSGLRHCGSGRVGGIEPTHPSATCVVDQPASGGREWFGRQSTHGIPLQANTPDGGLAHADDAQRRADGAGRHHGDGQDAQWEKGAGHAQGRDGLNRVADTDGEQPEPQGRGADERAGTAPGGLRKELDLAPVGRGGGLGCLANAARRGQREFGRSLEQRAVRYADSGLYAPSGLVDGGRPGPTNGAWRDADWLFCRDVKWRPVEPGTSPLAHGASARVGRLRAYGNAISGEAAAHIIAAFLESEADGHAPPVPAGSLIGHNGGPSIEDLLS